MNTNRHSLRFRQIHLDFHTSPHIFGIGVPAALYKRNRVRRAGDRDPPLAKLDPEWMIRPKVAPRRGDIKWGALVLAKIAVQDGGMHGLMVKRHLHTIRSPASPPGFVRKKLKGHLVGFQCG